MAKESWRCPTCETQNAPSVLVCDVCDRPRPPATKQPRLSPAELSRLQQLQITTRSIQTGQSPNAPLSSAQSTTTAPVASRSHSSVGCIAFVILTLIAIITLWWIWSTVSPTAQTVVTVTPPSALQPALLTVSHTPSSAEPTTAIGKTAISIPSRTPRPQITATTAPLPTRTPKRSKTALPRQKASNTPVTPRITKTVPPAASEGEALSTADDGAIDQSAVVGTSTPVAEASSTATAAPSATASAGPRNCPRPEVCILQPGNGVFPRYRDIYFTGTAQHPNFQRYKFEAINRASNEKGTVAEFWKPVQSGELMRFVTQSMPPGRYIFRLIVIDNTGNSWPEIAEVEIELQ